ncbi:DoxX family protein [Rugamonas sp.]|uniref:DoxX family protein n=1 Tax=Rugamonas sp. TaxID=1926287 RepID=UPI0025D42E1F|nr:DoxX family protein [Rugamonas sp.]
MGVRGGRLLLALFFVIGGVLHFVLPSAYVAIMPPWLDWPLQLVYLSGVCEIAGGLGVLPALTRRAAGIGLILLSIAVLPANVQMLLNAVDAAKPLWQLALLTVRLPLQLALIWWIWTCSVKPSPSYAPARPL